MHITVDNSNFSGISRLLLRLFIGARHPVAPDKLPNLAHIVELVIHGDSDVGFEDYTFGFAGELLT